MEMYQHYILLHQSRPECPARIDIIYGTDLIKIGEGNMPMLFINPYRSDGGRNLLDQCKPHFAVAGIGMIDKFFQSRTTKSSRIPGCHFKSHPFPDRFSEKRRQWCLKFLSRKAGKISVTFRKIKAVCVEKLRRKTIFFFQSVIESPVPIFIISCNGMTDGCKMGTDLMRLSSDQMNL